jgi:hypothetical protein
MKGPALLFFGGKPWPSREHGMFPMQNGFLKCTTFLIWNRIRNWLTVLNNCVRHRQRIFRSVSPSLAVNKGNTILPMTGFNTDVLFIAEKTKQHL